MDTVLNAKPYNPNAYLQGKLSTNAPLHLALRTAADDWPVLSDVEKGRWACTCAIPQHTGALGELQQFLGSGKEKVPFTCIVSRLIFLNSAGNWGGRADCMPAVRALDGSLCRQQTTLMPSPASLGSPRRSQGFNSFTMLLSTVVHIRSMLEVISGWILIGNVIQKLLWLTSLYDDQPKSKLCFATVQWATVKFIQLLWQIIYI